MTQVLAVPRRPRYAKTMRLLSILLIGLLLSAAADAQQVYRWVDSDGVVHYSDQPPPDDAKDATEVDVPRATVYRGPSVQRRATTTPRNSTPATPPTTEVLGLDQRNQVIYEQVIISRPTEQQVIWNIATRLPVDVRVIPALAEGHQIRFKLDGQPIGEPQELTTAVLSPVYRGEHRLEVEVINASGTVVFRSPERLFYVQQASIRN